MSTSSAVVPDSDLEQPASDSEQPQLQFDIDESFENAVNADVFEEPSHSPIRRRRILGHFEDVNLSDEDINNLDNSNHIDTSEPSQNTAPPQSRIRRVLLTLQDKLQTSFNSLGLCRLYPRRLSFEPDKFVPSSLLSSTCPAALPEADSDILPPPYPFTNMTVYRLMSWMNSGSNKKSEAEVARLVKEVMLAEDFDLKHLENFSVRKSLCELDSDFSRRKIEFPDDWLQADVTIKIPTKSKEDDAKSFSVPGFHFCPLVKVIRSAFTDVQARAFHLSPFKRLWKDPLDNHKERIFDELYTSDSWLDAQDEVQKLPREPGCTLEQVVASLMFFSDAMHLANFGTAKAWPLYMYFGNLTKYAHSAPKSGACHLVGFLPSLPDKVKDILSNLPRVSKSGMAALHTHCRRELFHACWDTLLDQDFLYAYCHGIVLKCADSVLRRIFPRIFTYSANYPEKVLIATIKDMGTCPCPRCLTPKSLFPSLGLLRDMKSHINNLRVYVSANVIKAREYIYKSGNTVDGTKVGEILGEGSWVPVLNIFAEKLGAFGLDPFWMLVVDFMHECELGTWKALFTHLVRILYSLPGGNKLVATLDARFCQVPTFSNGVIRMFTDNTSEIKRLAARDFEDILQCAIPVFEGLFPDTHDKIVQSLLFRFAQWHALVKLRIHSESSLCFFEKTFKILSKQLRKFCDFTCAAFETHGGSSEFKGPRIKKFNLSTYKFHAMGDYVRTIKLFGTTDSFTTQIGELAHRALKAFYPLTSKLDTPAQLAKHERRCCVLRRVAEAGGISSSNNQSPADCLPPTLHKHHHFISPSRNDPISLFEFLQEHDDDPATKNFIPKLKDHILYRLKKLDVSHCDRTFSDKERNSVIIPNNTVYSVKTMQVHYTTYDMRREYDTINPRTSADLMVLSGETSPSHPYWYARVLGIYHMETWLKGLGVGRPEKQHLEVLHVRWLAPLISSDYQSGMQCACLPKLAFVEESDYDAFGFLDPGQVVRGSHLIPAFISGRGVTSLRHGKSLAQAKDELDDWEEYYVGIFVDRDMFLRYTYLGVGHPTTLRRIVKDSGYSSLESATVTPVEYMDVDSDEARNDGEGGSSKDNDEQLEQMDVDLQLEDEEDSEFRSEYDYGYDDIEGGLGEEEVPDHASDSFGDSDLDDDLSF
ncbi:hypothetical protein BDR06DRAFT_1014331 [Suillus hirtellus]|nr:hypothetical protein BDR06DRAFT_1014331 [Suillus hirtellus]